MKRNILTLVATLLLGFVSTSVSAQTYKYLTFKLNNASQDEMSIDLTKLKLTFNNGNLVATSASDTKTLSIASLSSMFFTEEPTGIESASSSAELISFEAEQIKVNAPSGTLVTIFDALGRTVGQSRLSSTNTISTSSLSRGMYVVRVGQRTSKFLKR